MNELQAYFEAGYKLQFEKNPPYASSSVGMAFAAGVYCVKHFIPMGKIKAGRGYKMVVDNRYILDFKNSDINPVVSQK